MSNQPLELSIYDSRTSLRSVRARRVAVEVGDDGACWFCGCSITHYAGLREKTARFAAPICCLCHLCQHLERPEIEREAVVIWLPEFTQGALNALVRKIHLTLAAHDKPLGPDRRALHGRQPLLAAASAYAALDERSAAAKERIGTASPRELAEALSLLSAGSYARRTKLLGGARLLPLGRFFVDGRDVYPQMLKSVEATTKFVSPMEV
ncbi:hypothetical protein WOB59_00880 [Methylocystis sp. IM4]|uniref:hypothetical protein n=1 Tax=Methylocystis sp. IM4 TaxID=3136560 RepID=UPI0031193991